MNKKTESGLDYVLLTAVILLLLIGVLMVYSASSVWSDYKFDDPNFYLKRQLLFAVVGLIGIWVMVKIPYFKWVNWAVTIYILCILLLIALFIPGIGMVRGGANSWIGVGAFSIQPSEFMKLGLILLFAKMLPTKQHDLPMLFKGFLPMLLLIIFPFGLIMLQPDLGTGLVLVLTGMLILFVTGAKINHFIGLAVMGLVALAGLIISAPYRISRIQAFLNPWEDPLGDGFQIIQSLYAIGPGGLMGLGFGNSMQKYFYLPEPQTDFIFSVIAEELGLIGGSFILFLFLVVVWRGILISVHAQDHSASILAFGITSMIVIQVMINISVVIGLIPVTGITLPLLSYGGSSLTLTLLSIGILLNISRYATIK
ncbi:stage V sporulation protein E [Aquisalibacillus elongatus]|uniref:Spore cortex peptidoglycan biosynthesis regulator SpoVE n=1 Tax=Aquisalibacillus elongatus TaxID=485577 RepID=A0A3N5BH58_9BACI|nr:stage V sporulation protein E [Aquisalibacillus elongatus]RPF56079.1 spore cortex peptidoglycan biosynthesis regulator SpoVE [Aquisalibacillus elongatus]